MPGLTNPWVIVAALIALAAAGSGGGYVGWKMRAADAEKDRVAWEKTRKEEAVQAANEIDRAHREARAAEQRAAMDAASDAVHYQRVIDDAHAQRDRDVAAARAGAVRMRVPGGCRAVQTDQGRGGAPAPERPGDHGPADAELPREVAADLAGLADDADDVVRQLAAAQQRLLFDQAHCGPVRTSP